MSALNPANVPEVTDRRWMYASNAKCSPAQRERLSEYLQWEGIKEADLFGDGFTSIPELSRWAVHWAIDLLESRMAAREFEAYRANYEELQEQRLKASIAAYYRPRMKAQKAHG